MLSKKVRMRFSTLVKRQWKSMLISNVNWKKLKSWSRNISLKVTNSKKKCNDLGKSYRLSVVNLIDIQKAIFAMYMKKHILYKQNLRLCVKKKKDYGKSETIWKDELCDYAEQLIMLIT